MISIFTVLIVVVLNLVPADVTTFTMETSGNDTIRFTEQEDGGWNIAGLPVYELATFYVDGTKLTINVEGKKHTQEFAERLGIDKDADWKELNEFEFGTTHVLIDRKADGLDFVIREKRGDSVFKQAFNVRWDLREGK